MVISISNYKGGTGKTTTSVNIASALTKKQQRVLLIDLDPQGNLTYSLGKENLNSQVADVLLGKRTSSLPVYNVSENLDLIPWDSALFSNETELRDYCSVHQFKTLAVKIEALKNDYDYFIIDCPPAFSVFTWLAYVSSDYILIPVLLDVLSLQGLNQLLGYLEFIRCKYNKDLSILGVLPVMVDERRHLSKEILKFIKNNFDVHVFKNHVRANVKAAEAPSFGQSVIDYAPKSRCAMDYLKVTNEALSLLKVS